MSGANVSHEGDLVPIITMIKGWNKSQGSFFRSFHLEVLALSAFQNVRITDFRSGLRFFFEKAAQAVTYPAYDPAGYGDDVGRYLQS